MYKRFHKGLAAIAKCLNIEIVPITQEWTRIYLKRCKHRGKKDTVKFFKELNTAAERYALHQYIEPIPWTKSGKDNYPKILNFAKAYLRSENNATVVLTLSVFRTVEVFRLPISKDVSTVTAPCEAEQHLIDDILAFIPIWTKRFPPLKLKKMKSHFTLKGGPNGHAIHSSDSDISAIMEDNQILEAIQVVDKSLKVRYRMKKRKRLVTGTEIHSKLTQFPEKAGKTRTIAIIDYYSQRCLKPLHNSLMHFLGKLVSDGTYSHNSVGNFVKQKTLEKSFVACSDLTAATDRFPAVIQKALLKELLQDDELCEPLWTLLAKRSFKLAWSDEIVTYNCGQPMGAYASWPLFASAHHLIVEYCAFKVGKTIKGQYRIIGDDNAITDKEVYTAYLDVMSRLGLTINKGKSVVSSKGADYSAAEVAKQLYLNGKCLTPLTDGFIRNIKKPHMFNTCMGILIERYDFVGTELPSMLIDSLFKSKRTKQLVWLLASNPMNGHIKPTDVGYEINCPWDADKSAEYLDNYHKIIISKLLDQAYLLSDRSLDMMMGGGSPWKDSTSPEPQCMKAIQLEIEGQLTHVINELGDISVGQPIDKLVAMFDFVPDPFLPYEERRETKQKRMASVLESLLDYKDERTFTQIEW
jgi:hypothetical protein